MTGLIYNNAINETVECEGFNIEFIVLSTELIY